MKETMDTAGKNVMTPSPISARIHTVRGQTVMLDRDPDAIVKLANSLETDANHLLGMNSRGD